MELKGENSRRFFAMVMAEMQGLQELENLEQKQELGQALLNTIWDDEGPRTINATPSDKAIFVANKLFRPMAEIVGSLENIENIATYIRSFPYRKQGISRLNYLRYHIESYYEEIYLLKERLISYLNRIKKSYRKSDNCEIMNASLDPLFTVVSEVLKGYTSRRGVHVHQSRYTDEEFDRLSLLELLSKGNAEFTDIVHRLFIDGYKDARRRWHKRITTDMAALHELLDLYFRRFIDALSKDGRIVYPSNVHWA